MASIFSIESCRDFDLSIHRADSGHLVRVLRSPAGEARAEFELSLSDSDADLIAKINRNPVAPFPAEVVKTFGAKLYNSLFQREVATCLHRSLGLTENSSGLRIRLRTAEAPEYSNIPWELLYDQILDRFLALSKKTPLVRYIDLPVPPRPLHVRVPLRLLLNISSPIDLEPIDVEQEERGFIEALAEDEGLFVIDVAKALDFRRLRQRIEQGGHHILHFIGHGDAGGLLFERESGHSHFVSNEDFGSALHGLATLRLVVLNACRSANFAGADIFAGTAQFLIQREIPAAIGMQIPISHRAAVTFARAFYGALARGVPIDESMTEARIAMKSGRDDLEWATPVLYSRAPDGRIFDFDSVSRNKNRASQRQILYNLPSLPQVYEPREDETVGVRDRLLASDESGVAASAPRAVGLLGMGGIGKTVLATALVHDAELRAAFSDGIFWLSFGRNAPVLARAAEFAFALTGVRTSYGDSEEARGELGLRCAEKRLLVILDDVWDARDVIPFSGLGLQCRLLITARNVGALKRVETQQYHLKFPDSMSARSLLAKSAGVAVVEALPPEADQIIDLCGRLPLALASIGALIRRPPFDWRDALDALTEAALPELDTSWLPDPEQRTLAKVLQLSVDKLPDEERKCFLHCSALRKGARLREAVFMTLWSALAPRRRKRILLELVDRSLIQRDGSEGRYRIHDLYMDYLRSVGPSRAGHQRIIETYRSACLAGWASGPDDGYFTENLLWHLREAGLTDAARGLLFDPSWLFVKLVRCGINALVGDFPPPEEDREAARLASALRLSGQRLASNPGQFDAQVCGRLVEEDGPAIAQFLNTVRARAHTALVPVGNGYLTRPGLLLRAVTVDAGEVIALAVTPDERRVLTGSHEGVDRFLGQSARRGFRGQERPVLNERQKKASRAPAGRVLQLWDLESGAELARFVGHDGSVSALALMPDGKRVLSGSDDGTVRMWDLNSGSEVQRFDHEGRVHVVRVFAAGRRAVTGSNDRHLRIWDLEAGVLLRRLEQGSVKDLAMLADDRRVLAASTGGSTLLWDLDDGIELMRFDTDFDVTNVAVNAKGSRALTACRRGIIRLWELEYGKHPGHLGGTQLGQVTYDGEITFLTTFEDGIRVLAVEKDLHKMRATLLILDIETGAEIRRFSETAWVSSAAILANGRQALLPRVGSFQFWDLQGHAERTDRRHEASIHAVAVLPGGRRALSTSFDGALGLWDFETGAMLRRMESEAGSTHAISLVGENQALVSCGGQTLELWDLERGALVHSFELQSSRRAGIHTEFTGVQPLRFNTRRTMGRSSARPPEWGPPDKPWNPYPRDPREQKAIVIQKINALSLGCKSTAESPGSSRADTAGEIVGLVCSATGKRVLLSLTEGAIQLWGLYEEAELQWSRREQRPYTVALALKIFADDRRAISVSTDGLVTYLDLEGGATLSQFEIGVSLSAVAVQSNAARMLVGARDDTLRLIDLETGAELRRLVHSRVSAVALHEEGRHALSGSADGTLKLWDLEVEAEIAEFMSDDPITAVAISRDGEFAVVGDVGGRVLVFNISAFAPSRL